MGKGGTKGFGNGTIGTKLCIVSAGLFFLVHLISFGAPHTASGPRRVLDDVLSSARRATYVR